MYRNALVALIFIITKAKCSRRIELKLKNKKYNWSELFGRNEKEKW